MSPWVADLAERRRRALGEVTGELSADRRAEESAVALRDYGPGCVALGIAGPVDRAMAERLHALLVELRARGRRELVITLAGLGSWHPKLARVKQEPAARVRVAGGRTCGEGTRATIRSVAATRGEPGGGGGGRDRPGVGGVVTRTPAREHAG